MYCDCLMNLMNYIVFNSNIHSVIFLLTVVVYSHRLHHIILQLFVCFVKSCVNYVYCCSKSDW